MKKEVEIIKQLSNEELISISKSVSGEHPLEDIRVRELCQKIFGNATIVGVLGLGHLLMAELAFRLRNILELLQE